MCSFYRLFVCAAITIVVPHHTFAHSGSVYTSRFGTPTIDGIRGIGEWDAAPAIPVFTQLPGSTLLVLNDNSNLYFALSVVDNDLSVNDVIQMRFDDDHNGVTDAGDDGLYMSVGAAFSDTHSTSTSFENGDIQQDGSGAAGHAGTLNFFELSHPLNSGDPNDFAVARGETIGFAVRYFLDGINADGTTFPAGSFFGDNGQLNYADLIILPEPMTWVPVLIGAAGLCPAAFSRGRRRTARPSIDLDRKSYGLQVSPPLSTIQP
jgi:hypothetical protein